MRTTTAFLFALLGSACDPTRFDALHSEAPVFVVRAPDGRSGAFGATLTAYTATVGGRRVSRFVVAGGPGFDPGTTYHLYGGFEGDDSDATFSLDRGSLWTACISNECGMGYGGAVAAFPEWRWGGLPAGAVLRSCFAVPAPGSRQVVVRCEEQCCKEQDLCPEDIRDRCEDRRGVFYAVELPSGMDFSGVTAVGVAVPSDLGVAVLGAPAADGGNGALYRLPIDGGSPIPIPIDLMAAGLPPGARLGSSIAVTAIEMPGQSMIRFAAGTDSMTDGPRWVIVGTIHRAMDSGPWVEIHACLEGEQGWGRALAWGDLNGDGHPDLAIGVPLSDSQRVVVYDGSTLSGTRRCGDSQPAPARTLRCSEFASPEVPCTDDSGEFGASLAVGDVDGDGTSDLIVGAPGATPRGHAGAGAVFVLAGAGALTELGARHAALFASSVRPGMRLGATVAALRGRGRDEVIAGAPQAGEVHVFLCSGLEGDRPSDVMGRRGCLPR